MGFDSKYVPVPWNDFKITQNANLLVLDTVKATMEAASEVSEDQFTTTGHFDQESHQVDTYWKSRLADGKSGN